MRKRQEFNLPMLVITLALGAAVWFLCAALYGALEGSIPDPLLIGLLFGILALVVAVGVFLVSSVSGTFEKNLISGGQPGSAVAFLIIGVLLLAALAALFQWLYSLRFRSGVAEPTSYIFLIDDSGSTSSSDPQQLRYDAINQVLQNKDADFPYMVYGFADGVTLLREMKPISAGVEKLTGISDGQTAIKLALERVIDDYRNQLWTGGAAPKVVLLTDGAPTDFEFFSQISGILSEYSRNNISISVVGLGGADSTLMEQIAIHTNGIYVDIQDAAMLAEAMTSAATYFAAGDLVSTRYDSNLSGLFGFLRILFLAILGTGIGLLAMIAYGQPDSIQLILLSSIAASVIGSLLLELPTSLLDAPDRPLWFVLWVLIAATLCTKTVTASPDRLNRSRRTVRPSRSRRGRANRNI